MSKKLSLEVEQEIINQYQNGLSMAKVGTLFNVSGATVMRVLERNNIPKRTKGGIYQLPEEQIVERYTKGESCQKIANDYKVSFHTISSILDKFNISRTNKYHNQNLDENYFENIDRLDKAYFLGFMLTDGNISAQENIIRLTLAAKDEEILKVFSRKCGNTNKISMRQDEHHNERIFQLRSSKWKNDLEKYGVVPAKTHISSMPTLSEDMMPHLLRGMFDGDGWISAKSHQIGFCGNEQTVAQVKMYLCNHLDVFDVKILHPDTHLWQITWAAKQDILKIGNFIYNDKQDCFLQRKYDNFLSIIHGNTEVISQIAKG